MAETPTLRVTSIRQIYNDGLHNAFTDLCWFQDRLYLTFRNCPDGHMVFPSSKIRVLSSVDGQSWTPVFSFSVPDRDVRDPHFLVFKDTLFVYTGTWWCESERPKHRDINQHVGFAVWSRDGQTWQGPQCLEGTFGHYIWRTATHGGKAYLCGRRRKDFVQIGEDESPSKVIQSALLESEDGLVWRTRSLFAESDGDETAFLFRKGGKILAIVRGPGGSPAQICSSSPPYQQWDRSFLSRNIGGPLLTEWKGHLLVAGRKTDSGQDPKTALSWLIDGQLEEILELPSGGDNSYPGFVTLDRNRGLLSYYSSHEGPSSIYLADLELAP